MNGWMDGLDWIGLEGSDFGVGCWKELMSGWKEEMV